MASIKELVQKESEALAKAQKLKASIEKVAANIVGRSEISKAAKERP